MVRITTAMVVEACRGIATEEECADIAELDVLGAIGYAFTVLAGHGIEDPEAFLRDKGILE